MVCAGNGPKAWLGAYEGFLGLDTLAEAADLLKARAVYLTCWCYAAFKLAVAGGAAALGEGWGLDGESLVVILVAVLTANMLRYHKVFESYAALFSVVILGSLAFGAISGGEGVHTPALPALILGVIVNSMVANWRWAGLFALAGVAFAFMLTSITPPVTADGGVSAVRRAGETSLLVLLTAAIAGLFGASVDRMFAELERSAEKARRAEATKAEFLANMSHELRTPLNGIIGMTELMERTDLTPRQRQYSGIVARCSGSLAAIITEILDICKLDTGTLRLSESAVDIRATLRALAALHQPACTAKGLRLEFAVAPDVPACVVADGVRLRQILNNLLSNAVKYTVRGGVRLSVHSRPVSMTGAPRSSESRSGPSHSGPSHWVVTFEVADSGPGIAPEDQRRVFEDFERLHTGASASTSGTGLGLASGRRLVEAMGGELGLVSVPGHGTRVAFALCFAAGPVGAAPSVRQVPAGQAPGQPSRHPSGHPSGQPSRQRGSRRAA